MLSAVAWVAERDVAAFLAAPLSPVEDGGGAGDGRHDRQGDADCEAGAVTGLDVELATARLICVRSRPRTAQCARRFYREHGHFS